MSLFKKSMLVFLIVVICLITTFASIFFLCFKTDFYNVIKINAEKNNIDKALIFSIIKAESKFNVNAKSKANAIGLMQIKLSTANYLLSIKNKQGISENELYNPSTNIEIGVEYFTYLLNKFEVIETSICAYNAGETVVREWLANINYSIDGKTLKNIPYSETNNYLKKVMFNYAVYKKIVK